MSRRILMRRGIKRLGENVKGKEIREELRAYLESEIVFYDDEARELLKKRIWRRKDLVRAWEIIRETKFDFRNALIAFAKYPVAREMLEKAGIDITKLLKKEWTIKDTIFIGKLVREMRIKLKAKLIDVALKFKNLLEKRGVSEWKIEDVIKDELKRKGISKEDYARLYVHPWSIDDIEIGLKTITALDELIKEWEKRTKIIKFSIEK